MKPTEIAITGKITPDGKLSMFMGELNEFLSLWKNSKVVVRVYASQPGTSEAFKGYYYNYMVPRFRKAIWENGERLTEEQTEIRMRELSPICIENIVNPTTGKYDYRLREISELGDPELLEHIEHLRQIAAEEYSFFIEDTNNL